MATALSAATIVAWLAAPSALASIAGVVPDQPWGMHAPRVASVFGPAVLDYQTGPVMHSNRTHVIFWNPSNSLSFDPGYQQAIIGFLQNVAADSHKSTNVYALTPQYTDTTPGRAFYDSTFAGAIQDTDAAPPNGCTLPAPPPVSTGPTLPDGVTGWPICLTQGQIQTEITHVVTTNHLPTGLGDIYFLVTPDGFGTCASPSIGPNDCSLGGFGNPSGTVTGSYCGFHTFIGPSSNPTLYGNIPYNNVPTHCHTGSPSPNGTADTTISSISHEHNETITDPLLNAWINGDFSENGDLCALVLGPNLGGSSGSTAYNQVIGSGHYFIQAEWSNEDANGSSDTNLGCKAADEADSLSFSVPSSITPGSSLTLSGGATDPDGLITSFGWSFGDGSPPAAGSSVSHTFATTGVYQVTMSTTDIGGQQQSLTHLLTVDRPPVAAFSVTSPHPVALDSVKFSGAGSTDPDGSVASYRWNFGDGSTGTGVTATNEFLRPGTYTVQLTVTDNLGVSSTASHQVTVAPFPTVKPAFTGGKLRITVNGPGTITVAGKRTVVKRAGTVKLQIPLTARQRRQLQQHHVLRLRLKIVFKPRFGDAVGKTITVTLHG